MSITTYARHLDRCAGCRSRHTPGPYEGVSYMCDLPRRSAVRPRGLAVARKHASSLRALPPYCTRSRRVHCDSEPEESPHGERHPSCRASYPALSSHAHSPPIAVTLNRPSLSFSSARRPPLPPPCPLHSFNCRHQPTPSAICAPCPVCWWGLPCWRVRPPPPPYPPLYIHLAPSASCRSSHACHPRSALLPSHCGAGNVVPSLS